MRLVAIPALLLVLAGLAVLPHAAADPACTTDLCGTPAAPACPDKTYALGPGTGDSLTSHPDCTFLLETGKDQTCVGAWSTTDEHQVGPVHWTDHRCTFPGGDPLCCVVSASSAQQVPPPCQDMACAPACRQTEVSDGTAFGLLGGLVQLGLSDSGPEWTRRFEEHTP